MHKGIFSLNQERDSYLSPLSVPIEHLHYLHKEYTELRGSNDTYSLVPYMTLL